MTNRKLAQTQLKGNPPSCPHTQFTLVAKPVHLTPKRKREDKVWFEAICSLCHQPLKSIVYAAGNLVPDETSFIYPDDEEEF